MIEYIEKRAVIATLTTLASNFRNWGSHQVASDLISVVDMVVTLPVLQISDIPALTNVINERRRQDAKWGQQDHDPALWMGILMEEVGELAQAVNETVFDNGASERAKGGYVNMRLEAVQVAAVAVALVEALDRRYSSSKLDNN